MQGKARTDAAADAKDTPALANEFLGPPPYSLPR